ncbi:MAG: SIR2 family protein [Verrucomicrobiales bacterium]|nr:SIR2 family protein [Verrucomicrobiales bacterium]
MSNEAIAPATFIREFTRELHNKNAAVFAGAGLSMDSGYVDWKGLLREFIEDLELDPDAETDLVTIAQFHCNQVGGKGALTQRIFDEFSKTKVPTENHRILSRLPIQSYWTTNYDKLIETALKDAKKVPDVKYTMKHLAVTRLDRDVAVYKMHGDIDHPAEAVISKDDYESYPDKMSAFVAALRGDLIERTFLFLGLSFADPNLDFILSRVRVLYEGHQRHHYSIQKRASKWATESDEEFRFRELKQHYFIKDLKRFGIQTVLVDDYPDITRLLNDVATRFRRQSVFLSGAAHDFGTWSQNAAEGFLHSLSYTLARSGCRIVTGFGLGVGGPVINGSLAWLNDEGKTISDEDIVMRPFPQVATGGANLADQWKAYREQMLSQAGIVVFVFGNKVDSGGKVIPSNGMRQEFEIAMQAGLIPIPIGATGFMADELWKEVSADLKKYIPSANHDFETGFTRLGDVSIAPDELLAVISQLIQYLQKN